MFPLKADDPYINKDGSRTTLGDITGDISGIMGDIDDLDGRLDAAEDDIDNIANSVTPISQTGTTSTAAITSGSYFYLDGALVKAITNIAIDDTFTANTNYEVVTAGGLNTLASQISNLVSINDIRSYFSFNVFNPREFVANISVPTSITFNNIAFQWNGNINIQAGTYTANQSISGQEGLFVRLFALDGDLLQKLFPTIDNYAVGDALSANGFLYSQGSAFSIGIATVYIVKHSNTQSYVCTTLLKGTSEAPTVTVNDLISIKTGQSGMLFKPVIRFN